MKYSKLPKLFSVFVLCSFVFAACGDDPASTNEDPPEFPQFNSIEPDLSYLESNPPQNSNSNYAEAYSYGIGLGGVAALSQMYSGFFASASQNQGNFENGEWNWQYSTSYNGQSVDISLTAEESGEMIVWEMLWSYDDGQGNSYTDYRMVQGEAALDGTSGSWTFNALNPDTNEETPVLISEWSSSDDNNLEIITNFYEDGTVASTYTYTQNEDEVTVLFTNGDQENDITVFWNESAMTGYYQVGSDTSTRSCWGSDFEDVTCSAVGY